MKFIGSGMRSEIWFALLFILSQGLFTKALLAQEENLKPRIKNRIVVINQELSKTQSQQTLARPLLEQAGGFTALQAKYGPATIQALGDIGSVIEFDDLGDKTEEQVAKELIEDGLAYWAEPDYKTFPVLEPNDPLFSSYRNQHDWIGAPKAWDIIDYKTEVKVLVCDTGIQGNHPDLVDRLDLPGRNFADNNNESEDLNGHGTHVAGTIGSTANNSRGGVGVSWQSRITPGKISYDSSGYSSISAMAACITYAADNGHKIVNLSFSGYGNRSLEAASKNLYESGGLLFMAAGNSNQNMDSLVDSEYTVVIGAALNSTSKASFSNYGRPIDVFAPGVNILATYPGSDYRLLSGTSMASPIAAGVGALLFAHVPDATPLQVVSAITATADDMGSSGEDDVYGHGLVRADLALQQIDDNVDSSEPKAIIDASVVEGQAPLVVNLSGARSYDPDGTIEAYQWSTTGQDTKSGVTTSYTFDEAGTYEILLKVMDNSGEVGQASVMIDVKSDGDDGDGSAPVAVIDSSALEGPAPHVVQLNGARSYDSDGNIEAYEWSTAGQEAKYTAQASFTFNQVGSYQIQLRVLDDSGKIGTALVQVRVLEGDDDGDPPPPVDPPDVERGLLYEYYEGNFTRLPRFNRYDYSDYLVKSGVVSQISLDERQTEEGFAFRFKGYILIGTSGTYAFYTRSDDGSKVLINGKTVVRNKFKGKPRVKGGRVNLTPGLHEIEVIYYNSVDDHSLRVVYGGPDIPYQPIPAELLFHSK